MVINLHFVLLFYCDEYLLRNLKKVNRASCGLNIYRLLLDFRKKLNKKTLDVQYLLFFFLEHTVKTFQFYLNHEKVEPGDP
jgi:hypothetical protein